MWIFSEKPFNGHSIGSFLGCVYLYELQRRDYIGNVFPLTDPIPQHETVTELYALMSGRSCGPVDWGRRLVPLGRPHARTRTVARRRRSNTQTRALTRTLSCPSAGYSAKHANTHTHAHTLKHVPHTHTHRRPRVRAPRTRTKNKTTDDVDARARYSTLDVGVLVARTTGWGTAEKTKLENCRRKNA
jgi:hypothetical protein